MTVGTRWDWLAVAVVAVGLVILLWRSARAADCGHRSMEVEVRCGGCSRLEHAWLVPR